MFDGIGVRCTGMVRGWGREIHCGYMIPGNRPQIGREMKGETKNESEDNERRGV